MATHSKPSIAVTPDNAAVETVHLVGIESHETRKEAEEHLGELGRLTATLGLEVTGTSLVRLRTPTAKFLLGRGQSNTIAEVAIDENADCIVFDAELSPTQQRNWEAMSGLCVIDRQEVILDIFARHATSREAVLQVGLARAQYSLPRLTRAWAHLSRQRGGGRGGGGASRGEGEMQLEVDRRIVLRKIARFTSELAGLSRERETRRKRREAVPMPTASIVGYTNAGKSSLLNALTGARAPVADELFKTLDAMTRRVRIRNGHDLLLTDTVGFIRKLPHTLVDAFKSTLEEATHSDFLVVVLDASDPTLSEQYEITHQVLGEIGAGSLERLVVLNKCDLVESHRIQELRLEFPDASLVSAKRRTGLDALLSRLKTHEYSGRPVTRFVLPPTRHDLASMLHRSGRIVTEQFDETSIVITAQVPEHTFRKLQAFVQS